jgi:hypothetical protein
MAEVFLDYNNGVFYVVCTEILYAGQFEATSLLLVGDVSSLVE